MQETKKISAMSDRMVVIESSNNVILSSFVPFLSINLIYILVDSQLVSQIANCIKETV